MSRPFRYVGRSLPRFEDPEFLRGRTRYLDDIRLAGMLEVAFVRSPYAHARIAGVQADAARALEGVAAVVTAAEAAAAPEIVTGSSRPEAAEWRRPLLPGDRAGWQSKVACVYQKSMVVPDLTVAENLFLNRFEGERIRWSRLRRSSTTTGRTTSPTSSSTRAAWTRSSRGRRTSSRSGSTSAGRTRRRSRGGAASPTGRTG